MVMKASGLTEKLSQGKPVLGFTDTETWSVYNDMSFTIRADEGCIYIKDNNNQAFNKDWTLK